MDLLKAPSIPSLLDSDLESVESLPLCSDIDMEELDEIEYAIPASVAPTLAEALWAGEEDEPPRPAPLAEAPACSALQVDFLQGVSQQLTHAEERSSSGAATALSVSGGGRLAVGMAHGHLLAFQDQALRWVCNAHSDRGAVSCLAYNADGTRILVGFARGLICQYESSRGVVLRRVTLGGEIWGILRVTWAGPTGLALDTGGSVWLVKFSRPLGVRSSKTSCLFSGARGEVVAMEARDSRILALATLSRIIIVAGGRAAGLRFEGPPDTLPALCWSDGDERLLACARAHTLQWVAVDVKGSAISLRPIRRFQLKTVPLWLGRVGGGLAIFDVDENLRLWGDDYDKPLDLSQIEPVYASAFFKGLWTDGRVSRALSAAGAGALGGAGAGGGALALLGRRGVVRVRARDVAARAKALFSSGRHAAALRLLSSSRGELRAAARELTHELADRPHLFRDRAVANEAVKMCLKFDLSEELWGVVWERCGEEAGLVEALGDAAARGDLPAAAAPEPDTSQALLERLAECEPGLVERVLCALPLSALDPHRASVLTRTRKLWRAHGAVAARLGGCLGAMRELTQHVSPACGARDGAACACAGDALLLCAADGLAGRAAAGRALPDHARPSARHDALQALLPTEASADSVTPLRALAQHDARACVRLLQQGWREPPFAGPLGRANRLRVARALHHCLPDLVIEEQLEIIEFISEQLQSGALPPDRELSEGVAAAAAAAGQQSGSPRAERALLALARRLPPAARPAAAAARPRVAWSLAAEANDPQAALQQFFRIANPCDDDVEELFEYIRTRLKDCDMVLKNELKGYIERIIDLRPRLAAAVVDEHYPEMITGVLRSATEDSILSVAEYLLEAGTLGGDAAAAYFHTLCTRTPDKAKDFLLNHPGAVRPEEARDAVQTLGPLEALPLCLERTGDSAGALEAALRCVAAAGDEPTRARLVEEACALCSRAAAAAPREQGAALWARLARAVPLPPGALLDAAAYVPAGELVARTCGSLRAAATLVEWCAGERRSWQLAARLLRRELHARAARERRAAGRGCRVEATCASCGDPLWDPRATGAARVLVCAHRVAGVHAECAASRCPACPAVEPRAVSLPPRAVPAAADQTPPLHELRLVAPPRPDLEGIA